MNEYELDLAFATKLQSSTDFASWFLGRTKFARFSNQARLLVTEQQSARPKVAPDHWWRNWWCRLPDGSESETDIFAVFELTELGRRIALHIEDKPPGGRFTLDQGINYGRRAIFMANKERYLNYDDFETVLIAPESFLTSEECDQFGKLVSYEDLAVHILKFKESLHEASPPET